MILIIIIIIAVTTTTMSSMAQDRAYYWHSAIITPTPNSFIVPFLSASGHCCTGGWCYGDVICRYAKHLTKSPLNSFVFYGVYERIQVGVKKNQKHGHIIDLVIQFVSDNGHQDNDTVAQQTAANKAQMN